MAIPIWPYKTGTVFLRNFDEGIFRTMGANPDPSSTTDPCYSLIVTINGIDTKVPVYFSQPEAIFKKMVFPFITVTRDDVALAMHRWMGVGQLEYKVGVSGTQTILPSGVSGFSQYEFKFQAFPHDITYTIQAWDRYESPAQSILLSVLNSFYPVGKLIVYDSLMLRRTYEYYWEGSIANLQEMIDPVTRARGYALTIRVEGELDIANTPSLFDSVSGINMGLSRIK